MITMQCCLVFLLCSSLLLLSGRGTAVRIGVIIDPNFHAAREQKFAIEVATQRLNTSSSTLFLDVRLLNGSNPLEAALNARDLIDGWGADAIICGGAWPEVAPVADAGSRAGVPVLSLATTLPLRIAARPFLVWMSYQHSVAVRCIVELLKSYNLRRAIVIYEDDDYGSVAASITTLFHQALQAIGSDVDQFVAFPPANSLLELRAAVQRELETLSRRLCKVFVVLRASRMLAEQLFKEARKLGMMKRGHVWITDDETTGLLDSDFGCSLGCHIQGVVGIKPYFNESIEPYQNFEARLKQLFQSEQTKGVSYYQPGIHALHAYDAVHVIALAATVTAKMRSAALLQEILSINFKGLSGHIRFKRYGSLVGRYSSSVPFRVINFGKKSYKEIGFWSEGHGFYEGEDEIGSVGTRVDKLGPVYWPGGTPRVPGGWGKLKIGVPARTSFDQFVKVEYNEKGKVKLVTGYCIDIFNQTLKRLKYILQYELIPFNGTYDELVDQVYLKKFDAVVGDITILATRLEKVEFTEPYVASDLAMMVRVEPDQKAWVLMKPFTNGVWIVIVVTFVYTAIPVWYFERKSNNPEFSGPWRRQLGAALWLIFSTIFFAHKRIHSYYTKAVLVIWLFVALIITQIYTANLTSILTTRKSEPEVSYSKIGCDGDSFIVKYLQDVLGYPPQRIQETGAAENYPKAFESGRITAAYMETPYLRVFLSRHDGYVVYGETHRLGGLGFVFPKGSPLANDFSEAILQLSEEGVLKVLENKWFSFSLSSCPSTEKDKDKDSLSLTHLWVLFLLSGGTTTVVFLLFLAQILLRNRSRRRAERCVRVPEKCKRLWRSAKFWKKQEVELQNLPSISLAGNTTDMKIETMHDTTPGLSEGSSHATMLQQQEHVDVEQEYVKNQCDV